MRKPNQTKCPSHFRERLFDIGNKICLSLNTHRQPYEVFVYSLSFKCTYRYIKRAGYDRCVLNQGPDIAKTVSNWKDFQSFEELHWLLYLAFHIKRDHGAGASALPLLKTVLRMLREARIVDIYNLGVCLEEPRDGHSVALSTLNT